MADSNMYAFLPLSSKVLLCSAGVQTEIPVSRLHRGELMTFLTPYTAIIPSTQTLQGVSRVSWLPLAGAIVGSRLSPWPQPGPPKRASRRLDCIGYPEGRF